VKSVLTAEFAILLQLKSVGRILLVLFCVVVSLLALGACKSNLDSGIISHIVGTSCDSLFDRLGAVGVPPSEGGGWVVVRPCPFFAENSHEKRASANRGRNIIHLLPEKVNRFFEIFFDFQKFFA